MSASCVYRLEGVVHRYGGRPVFQVDGLEFRSGEAVCLLGPTGAGKSTLLRLLAGLETPTAGRVLFGDGGRAVPDLPLEVRRKITLVFQRPLLLTGTVRANVTYGLWLRGPGRHPPVVEDMLGRLKLTSLAGRSARTLSGGVTQLVALARALVLEPDVLLLDEPNANLDPARVARVEEVVGMARRQGGTTVVWATHNLFQARRVASRVALLLDGRLVEAAATEEFFNRPRDPRTAAFVRGEMVY
jgi:tungstate transport system ATP-binding protein